MISEKFINSGIYLFNKNIEDILPEEDDIEKTTFITLVNREDLSAFRYYGFYRKINNEKDLEIIQQELKSLR